MHERSGHWNSRRRSAHMPKNTANTELKKTKVLSKPALGSSAAGSKYFILDVLFKGIMPTANGKSCEPMARRNSEHKEGGGAMIFVIFGVQYRLYRPPRSPRFFFTRTLGRPRAGNGGQCPARNGGERRWQRGPLDQVGRTPCDQRHPPPLPGRIGVIAIALADQDRIVRGNDVPR